MRAETDTEKTEASDTELCFFRAAITADILKHFDLMHFHLKLVYFWNFYLKQILFGYEKPLFYTI